MLNQGKPLARAILSLAAILIAGGCDGGSDEAASVRAKADADRAGAGAARAQVEVPDPCTFFSPDELESAVGWQLSEGQHETAPIGSACTFERQQGMFATRTFPDPLPGSPGYGSLVIETYPTDAEKSAQTREMMPNVEDVPSIGDEAFFIGPALFHVRVGNRGFSVRINSEAESDADRAKVRAVLQALGRTGAARL